MINNQFLLYLFWFKQSSSLLDNHSMTDQQPPPTTNPPTHKDHSDSEESLSSLQSDELNSMLSTLHKFKRIAKEGQLTSLKKKNVKANQIFCQMSQFFHIKKNYYSRQQKESKEQRIQLRKEQLNSAINHKRKLKHLPQCHHGNETPPEKVQSDQPQAKMICYICRNKYQEVHPFYGYFCPPCSQLNLAKRTQKANLAGLTALVTGARIKIGFEIALKLLRDGAEVYASSRFPQDTLLRYKAQQDYLAWHERLHIIQCDFLCQSQVLHLISTIKSRVEKLDILINNAAQTIVRPTEFYSKEVQNQQLMLQSEPTSAALEIIRPQNTMKSPSLYVHQVAIKPEDIDLEQVDEFGQPTDKRTQNSWVQNIEEVPLIECLTTQVINSIVPFQLISQLTDKMKGESPSWIVNVSSMEGVFGRNFKSPFHPHTNMAKAALNMITRTCSQQLAKEHIFMNSVDTGWVTNENPLNVSEHMAEKHLFKCPLDCLDGAMRVLDPIYLGVGKQDFPFGLFLKNYSSSNW